MWETKFQARSKNKQNYSSVYIDLRVFGKEGVRQNILHGMPASIPCLQSALNFFMNGILISKGYSQIFEPFHPFTGCITYLHVAILSCMLVYRHDHTLTGNQRRRDYLIFWISQAGFPAPNRNFIAPLKGQIKVCQVDKLKPTTKLQNQPAPPQPPNPNMVTRRKHKRSLLFWSTHFKSSLSLSHQRDIVTIMPILLVQNTGPVFA